jgi:hypothetical protein
MNWNDTWLLSRLIVANFVKLAATFVAVMLAVLMSGILVALGYPISGMISAIFVFLGFNRLFQDTTVAWVFRNFVPEVSVKKNV